MNYKPDESTLMAFLYGELDAQEMEKVKTYLKQHPEEAAALKGAGFVRTALRQITEHEVIAPPLLLDQPPAPIRRLNGTVKTALGLAASVAILLAAGKLLGPEVKVADGAVHISFGRSLKETAPAQAPLSRDEVQNLIQESWDANRETLQTGWHQEQEKLQTLVRSTARWNDEKMKEVLASTGKASADQMESFVATLQKENLKMMQEYMSLTATDQKKYMEGLLADFSTYLQEQRRQDIQTIAARVSSVEKNNSQFREETGQILASILTAAGPTTKKQVNY